MIWGIRVLLQQRGVSKVWVLLHIGSDMESECVKVEVLLRVKYTRHTTKLMMHHVCFKHATCRQLNSRVTLRKQLIYLHLAKKNS